MKDIFVIFEFALGIHRQVTGVTVITEGVRIMLGLHMVPCADPAKVRKLVTQVAVESSVRLASAHKLKQITGILELGFSNIFLQRILGQIFWD